MERSAFKFAEKRRKSVATASPTETPRVSRIGGGAESLRTARRPPREKKRKMRRKNQGRKAGVSGALEKQKNPLSINKDFRWKFIGPSAGSNRWRRVYF
jgi:hypothetical protein